jgi:predicted GIY-YIG superfamily endonuclease
MAWVYILRTGADKYYIGSTANLSARLQHHFGGFTPSTRSLKVSSLALRQEYKTLKEARAIELKIKNLKRKDFIEKMIEDGYIRLAP